MWHLFYSDDDPGGKAEARQEPASTADLGEDSWWETSAPVDHASKQELERTTEDNGGSTDPDQVITKPLPAIVAPENHPPEPEVVSVPTASERGLAFAAQRDVGRVRSINQDSVFGMLSTVPRAAGDVPMGLFVVADGMGGHEGGEIASHLAISSVARVILADLLVPALEEAMTEPLQSLMTGALQEANRTIWHHAQSVGSDMGTTCTAVVLLGHTVYIGHVGDSRAYLVTPSGLHQLTTDHSAVGRLIELGQIDASEAREHPMRSHLYRTVGQTAQITVDYDYVQLSDATHLLLCSDGLWSMLEEADMLAAIRETVWPTDTCHRLIELANAAGGEDNISAVVVSLSST